METPIKYRDLLLISFGDSQLVIGCDSLGAIGNKAGDLVRVSPETVGYTTAKVALCEVLAIGAQIKAVSNTLSVEMQPTGQEIIKGIEKALKEIDLDKGCLTGSTEENFPVQQTAMGITVIGEYKGKLPQSEEGDRIVLVGRPSLGQEVIENAGEIFNHGLCKQMRAEEGVHEIIPCGSKGILHELNEIRKKHLVQLESDLAYDLERSCGPSTCAVITMTTQAYDNLLYQMQIPMQGIGWVQAQA